MNLKILAGMVIIVIVIAAGLVYYESGRIKADSVSHSYRYSVVLDADGPIRNATIMVPVGVVGDGYSPVADAIEYRGMDGVPAGWSLMLLNAGDSVYLKITAMEIEGGNVPVPVPVQDEANATTDQGGYTPSRLGITLDFPSVIDTGSPVGKEPLLGPKYNFTSISCGFPYPEDMPVSCSRYTIPLYTGYKTNADNTLSIEVTMEGENAWWLGGWTGNSYKDRTYISLSGSQDGWKTAEGSLVYGLGNY